VARRSPAWTWTLRHRGVLFRSASTGDSFHFRRAAGERSRRLYPGACQSVYNVVLFLRPQRHPRSSFTKSNIAPDATQKDPSHFAPEIMSPTLTSDLEAQATVKKDTPVLPTRAESEYNVPTGTKVAYLSVYFLLNVSLTIYNKAVLGKVSEPPRTSI
jgi:hypothetical protein